MRSSPQSTSYSFLFCLQQWWAMVKQLFYFKRVDLMILSVLALIIGLSLGFLARTLSNPQSKLFQTIDKQVNPETIIEDRLGIHPQKAIQEFQSKPQALQYSDTQHFSKAEQVWWKRFQLKTTFYEDTAHPLPKPIQVQLLERGIVLKPKSIDGFTQQAKQMHAFSKADQAQIFVFFFWMAQDKNTNQNSLRGMLTHTDKNSLRGMLTHNPVLGYLLLTDLNPEMRDNLSKIDLNQNNWGQQPFGDRNPQIFRSDQPFGDRNPQISILDVYTHLLNDVFKEQEIKKTISWPLELQSPSVESTPLFTAVDPLIHAHNWAILMFELYGWGVLGSCSFGFFMALAWGIEREKKRLEIWALSPLPIWVLISAHLFLSAFLFAGFFTIIGLCLWGMIFSLVGFGGLGYLFTLFLMAILGYGLVGTTGVFTTLYFRHPLGKGIARLWTIPFLFPLYILVEGLFMMQIWQNTTGLTQRVWALPSTSYMLWVAPLLLMSILLLTGWMERKIGQRREGLRA